MAEIIKICTICGREFSTHVNSAKFCSDACRAAGKKQTREAWERKTGFKEKQRKTMQEYRKKLYAENTERKSVKNESFLQELEELRKQREAERLSDLKRKAKKGDKLACMMIALKQHGLFSMEYWQAYADYEKELAESCGRYASSFVNDISVNDEEFALKVVVTLQELGHIRRESHTGEKINENC